MFKRVLVTLDGSGFSDAVLPEAAKLLRGTGAEIRLLTVHEEPEATAAYLEKEPLTVGIPAPGGVITMKPAPVVETKAQAIDRITSEMCEFLLSKAMPFDRVGIAYEAAVRFGDAAEEILRYAKEEKVDLIMMATHGHTGLGRLVFGSVASRVVRSGVCPVMVVRPHQLKGD